MQSPSRIISYYSCNVITWPGHNIDVVIWLDDSIGLHIWLDVNIDVITLLGHTFPFSDV
jgi:hypothetical protein